MPFNEVMRVRYKNSPLVQVVCQLRFPRILSIDEKSPAEFQECIREIYPVYNVNIEQQQQLIVEPDNGQFSKLIRNDQIKNHSFSSSDHIWRVSLTSTFLSLSTSQYIRWENFCLHLQEPLNALKTIYHPAFFERVGLRYVNAFQRSVLGLDAGEPWSQFIRSFALGFLSNNEIAAEVKGYSATSEIDLGNNAVARINTATGYVGNAVFQQNPEMSFIIDSDLFYNTSDQS